MPRKRRSYPAKLKAKVALEALREEATVADAAPARAVAAARGPDPGATGSDAGGVAAGVADVGEPPDDLASGHEARLPP